MRFVLAACILLSLTACAAPPVDERNTYETFLNSRNLSLPRPDHFQHCRGYGCVIRDDVTLSKAEWDAVTGVFRGVNSAADERVATGKAIGLLERIVGPKTGTDGDLGGTFRETGEKQMDCVDESTNTTMYLAMLQNDLLLKFHRVQRPTYRTPMSTMGTGKFWPHFTAVMTDKKTHAAWAVDSWARDNGFPAEILPLNDWVNGAGLSENDGAKFKLKKGK
ncbi:MAG: hypothetical protein JWO78_320 [Micavibrio sp.]|nr:hypothetical protein [Micavibrio sp.]